MEASSHFPLLSLTIWLPVFGGILLLFAGEQLKDSSSKWLALLISIVTFLLSLKLFTGFDSSSSEMQFVEDLPWIAVFDIRYSLGIDGIALPLILLTTLTTVLVIIAGWESITDRPRHYMSSFLVLNGLMIGVFSATDAILFYVFWEAMLIPMFLIIGIWGGPRRVYATIKFFLYTFLGSVFMLVALLYLYAAGDSFNIIDMHELPLGLEAQKYIFVAFFLAFAVKIPMWPVHTWLPDAHVEAPTGGSVILAAIMLKLGGYGFLRFSLPIAPDASQALTGVMIVLSLIAIVYIGFVALVQSDMKKLIAYSSISHMGFVTLGMFLPYSILVAGGSHADGAMAVEAGMVQMISHGFISGAMFLCVGVLYDRMHSREISSYGGVVNTMPHFAAFMVLFAMANAGLPGTSGFVGEFLVILAAFKANFWIAFFAAITLIVGAAYTLWMIKRVIFGDVANDQVASLQDINCRETLTLATLAFFVLLLGIWPDPLFELMHETIEDLIDHMTESKIPGVN